MMLRKTATWLGLSLLAGLVMPERSAAEHPWLQHLHCPKPSYSPLHYWTPTLYRVAACLHGPHVPLIAPVRCLPAGGNGRIVPYPCPPVDPAHYDSPYAGPVNDFKNQGTDKPAEADKTPSPAPAK
jgi:hypothetical protein